MKWFPAGNLEKNYRTVEQLKQQFANCPAGKFCKALYKGKLYHCLTGAIIANLDKTKLANDEYMEIDASDSNLWFKLKDFFAKEYATICDYCNNGVRGLPKIQPAEQAFGERHFSEYTLIKRSELEYLIR